MSDPSFEISFDPSLTDDQIVETLSALADYYRACGGVGFEVDFAMGRLEP